MSPQKKALGITVLLILYVVIAALGFFAAYYIKTNYFQSTKQTNTPNPTAIPAPSGFKTYESKEQHISLSYPSTLEVKEHAIGLGVKTVEMKSSTNTDTDATATIRILTVPKLLAKTIGQDFESFYNMQENMTKTIESPNPENKHSEQFTKIRNREVKGLRALDYTSVPSPNPDNQNPEIGTFVEADNNLIIFATSSDNRDQLEKVLKTFNYTH